MQNEPSVASKGRKTEQLQMFQGGPGSWVNQKEEEKQSELKRLRPKPTRVEQVT